MKFDLKTPCKDCPFLIGSSTNKSLDDVTYKKYNVAERTCF